VNELVPCPDCQRHVRSDERICPFCQTVLSPRAPCTGRCAGPTAARLAKAALVAAGAALLGASCDSQSTSPPYGLPPHVDAGTQSHPDGGEPTDGGSDVKGAAK
jgi:hypothetical protein